jgi:hypothetical protein
MERQVAQRATWRSFFAAAPVIGAGDRSGRGHGRQRHHHRVLAHLQRNQRLVVLHRGRRRETLSRISISVTLLAALAAHADGAPRLVGLQPLRASRTPITTDGRLESGHFPAVHLGCRR